MIFHFFHFLKFFILEELALHSFPCCPYDEKVKK
nr:MAG TPA: hypothetical protein [Ackermannviridae sp.]